MNRDQKLLSQLGFSDEQSLTVKSSGTGTPSGSSESSASASSSSSSAVFNSAYALEQVSDMTVHLQSCEHTQAYISSDTLCLCLSASRRSRSPVLWWLWCVMCLRCFTSWLTWMNPGTYTLLTAKRKKELYIDQQIMVSLWCHLSLIFSWWYSYYN